MFNSYLMGNYPTAKFTDIFYNEDSFISFLTDETMVVVPSVSEEKLRLLYYLLYARYGNSHFANDDRHQSKFKIWEIVYNYGPNWEKKLEIQESLRNLTEDELRLGSKAVYNHAYNPQTETTSTSQLEELPAINEQNTTGYKKSPIEGYNALLELLNDNITNQFLNRFKGLFLTIVEPRPPLFYEDEE